MAKSIPLTQGKSVIVDASNYEWLNSIPWRLSGSKNRYTYYATHPAVGLMHRYILGVTDRNLYVDHINHDGLDNRRDNLRVCTLAENLRNQRAKAGRFKGVSFYSKRIAKPWAAFIQENGKRKNLGYFATEIEAAQAYDKAATVNYGEFAALNFPKGA